MLETLNQIVSIRLETGVLVAGLTLACAFMLFHVTESKVLALIFAPVAGFCALVGIYFSRELGLYYSSDQQSNIILSSLIGVIISLVVVLVAARMVSSMMNALRKRQSEQLGTRQDRMPG